jgi:hypothetical protein
MRDSRLVRYRRFLVAVFGGTLLMIGLVMILLPGPAIIVIPVSLAILGTEFLWARNLKIKMDAQWKAAGDHAKRWKQQSQQWIKKNPITRNSKEH